MRVVPVTRDDWSRTVARVFVGEREVNAELVRAGAAWVYRRHSKDEKLLALEDEARRAKRGLWALPQAEQVPPWQWRQEARAPAHGERACGAKHYCREMTDCDEARWYLTHCDLRSLDGNGDGTPCSGLCRK